MSLHNRWIDNTQWQDEEELLDFYEEKFNLPRSRRPHKPRPTKNVHQKAAERLAEVTELADEPELAAGFETTYTPARFEAEWLFDSLRPLYDQALITDVVAQVKGGKEASVYRCRGHESVGVTWLAAKVYRPRKFRTLRNDAMYREGRQILTEEDGKPADPRDDRIIRAIGKKTTFGVQVQHTSWLMYEFTTLQTLYEAGAAVPRPWAVADNAILMGYLGDEALAAPTLQEVRLVQDEVEPLFEETLRNVELMLQHGLIHGDLSAYNILYWEGTITLIDFPQVVQAESNRNAHKILRRDVQRICDYFRSYGIRRVPPGRARQLTDDLWQRYAAPDPLDYQADLSRMAPDEE